MIFGMITQLVFLLLADVLSAIPQNYWVNREPSVPSFTNFFLFHWWHSFPDLTPSPFVLDSRPSSSRFPMFPRNIIYFSWRNQTLSPDIHKFTRSAWTQRCFWGEEYFRVLISSKNHSIYIFNCGNSNIFQDSIHKKSKYFRAHKNRHFFSENHSFQDHYINFIPILIIIYHSNTTIAIL